MKNIFQKKLRIKRMSILLGIITTVSIVMGLCSIVIPKIMAGDTVVHDLHISAQSEENIISLHIIDDNTTDTKVVIPLPEGIAYKSNQSSNIGVTEDKINHQLVIDWVDELPNEATLQLVAKKSGIFDFVVQTVRDDEPVSSNPCKVTIQTEDEPINNEEVTENTATSDNCEAAYEEVSEAAAASDTMEDASENPINKSSTSEGKENYTENLGISQKLPSDAHIDNSWLPLTDLKLSDKINIIESKDKPFVPSKYAFYPAYFKESIYKKNGQDITNDVSSAQVIPMNNLGDEITATVLGISLGEKVSGKITKKNNNSTYLGNKVAFPGVTETGKRGKGTINDVTTYGHLDYSFDRPLSGQLTVTDLDQNEAIGISLDSITTLYATSATTLYGKVVGDKLYVAGGTINSDWTSPNAMVSILFDEKSNIDIAATTEAINTAINLRPSSEGLVDVNKSLGVHYLDEDGETLAPMKLIEGGEGTAYEEKPIDIPGYRYKGLSSNSAPATGYFSDSLKNIEFVYEKLIPVENVTVRYRNTLGEKISDDVILSGNIGDDFETERKDIPQYTFKRVEGPEKGKFTDEPQVITYIYTSNVLRFYNVPSDLSFNETKISSHTQIISRKNPDWKIIVEDTRLKKNNWRITAKLVEQFKDNLGKPLKDDILLFRYGDQTEQWITVNKEVPVFDGRSVENKELYEASWGVDEGPFMKVAPGTVKVGQYKGIINWNLIDAPV